MIVFSLKSVEIRLITSRPVVFSKDQLFFSLKGLLENLQTKHDLKDEEICALFNLHEIEIKMNHSCILHYSISTIEILE